MFSAIFDKGIILTLLKVAAILVGAWWIASTQRYEISGSSGSVVWKLDRLTGATSYCIIRSGEVICVPWSSKLTTDLAPSPK